MHHFQRRRESSTTPMKAGAEHNQPQGETEETTTTKNGRGEKAPPLKRKRGRKHHPTEEGKSSTAPEGKRRKSSTTPNEGWGCTEKVERVETHHHPPLSRCFSSSSLQRGGGTLSLPPWSDAVSPPPPLTWCTSRFLFRSCHVIETDHVTPFGRGNAPLQRMRSQGSTTPKTRKRETAPPLQGGEETTTIQRRT